MPKESALKTRRPWTLEERLGHVWGVVFIAMVLVLAATLVGKGCFFPG